MCKTPSANELREFLKVHGLTGAAVARLVGVDSRTVRKWTASDEADNRRAMPWSAWALLRLMVGAATIDEVKAEAMTTE